jgi:hypothetical protein
VCDVAPRRRKRPDNEYRQIPMMIPIPHMTVPMSDDQTTKLLQNSLCLRSGVKYSQCSTALR